MYLKLGGIQNGNKNIKMKNKDLIFDLMQNSVVGAIAFHSFVLGYHNIAKHKENNNLKYPPINYFFFVLPIVYNEEAMETFKSSNELYSVLLKNKQIILELQNRANKMIPKTFSSLNMAFSKKILLLNVEQKTVELPEGFQSKKLALPLSMSSDNNSVKKIQNCAFKLGSIFAKRNSASIQSELNILF